MYLAIEIKTVIDVAFEAAVAEDLVAVPPIAGVAEVAEVSHEEIVQEYLEDSDAQVAINMANGLPIVYYYIEYNPALRPTLKTVRERGRVAAPANEIVTIETQDGVELGSGEV